MRTNVEGRFVFTDVPGGSYQVDVSKPGWLSGAFGRRRPGGSTLPVILAEAQHRNDLSITLWRPAVIAGIVTADNGDPLAGVEVRAVQFVHVAGRRQMHVPQRPLTIARQKTNDRGAYRFSDLMPGNYVIAILASVLSEPPAFDGAIRAATIVRAISGEPQTAINVDVRMVPTFQVSGVLTGPDGPAPWHAVHLVPADTGDTPLVDVGTAVTDADGGFTFYGVPSGQNIARVVRVRRQRTRAKPPALSLRLRRIK